MRVGVLVALDLVFEVIDAGAKCKTSPIFLQKRKGGDDDIEPIPNLKDLYECLFIYISMISLYLVRKPPAL